MGKLHENTSILRSLDPRAKLAAAFLFSLLVSQSNQFATITLALAAGAGCLAISGLPPKHIVKRAAAVNIFVAFLWLFLPWSLAPDSFRPAYNPDGMLLALRISGKVNAIFCVVLALLSTSSINALLHALNHLYMPRKLVVLFMLFHRYVHLLQEEASRLQQAMKARCFRPRANLHTWRSLANLAGMLLVRAYDRAIRVHQAMLCRGFRGTYWILDHFAWGRADTRFALLSAGLLSGLAGLEIWSRFWS